MNDFNFIKNKKGSILIIIFLGSAVLSLYAFKKMNALATQHKTVDAQLMEIYVMASQAEFIKKNSSVDRPSVNINSETIALFFGKQASFKLGQEKAIIRFISISPENYLYGLQKLITEANARIIEVSLNINRETISGSMELKITHR